MTVKFPVRLGAYQYVYTAADGTSTTLPVDDDQIERGWAEAEVADGGTIVEVALSSTSDPDLDPALGQLWPEA